MTQTILVHPRIFLPISTILVLLTIVGCSTTPDASSNDPSVLSSTDEQIFVGDAIEMNYNPNVIMKRAESFYEKEGYLEAIVEYQHFLDLHRTHILAPYAQYKLSSSHFKMFKTIDRDPEPIQKALDAFQQLLTLFPGNRYEKEAREKTTECKKLLAQHHLFVGQFYYRKQAYLAAAHRFEKVINTYPELEMAGEAQYQLAMTYNQLDLPTWSRDQLVALTQERPTHTRRAEGLQLLAKLQKDNPTMVVAQNKPLFPEELRLPSRTGSVPLTIQPYFNESPARQAPSLTLRPSVVVSSAPTTTDCPLGSWCETNHSPVVALPTNRPTPSLTTTCQPGVWC